jgi:hypothetical protein
MKKCLSYEECTKYDPPELPSFLRKELCTLCRLEQKYDCPVDYSTYTSIEDLETHREIVVSQMEDGYWGEDQEKLEKGEDK